MEKKPMVGTAFQQKVWSICSLIPEGVVVTYKDIATAMGQPAAVRAVANALGKNPLAPIVPCHRVIGGRSLGGYSGKSGLKTKRALLKKEKCFGPISE